MELVDSNNQPSHVVTNYPLTMEELAPHGLCKQALLVHHDIIKYIIIIKLIGCVVHIM